MTPHIPPSPAQVADDTLAFAPQARLSNLQQHRLHASYVVDDTVFPTLQQLTRLTHLALARIQLQKPAPGHLLALQILSIHKCKSVSQLHSTLLPLKPLPALTSIDMPVSVYSTCLEIVITHDGWPHGPSAVADRVALQQAMATLGSAPRLHLTHLTLTSSNNFAHLDGPAVSRSLAYRGATLLSLTLKGLAHMQQGTENPQRLASSAKPANQVLWPHRQLIDCHGFWLGFSHKPEGAGL